MDKLPYREFIAMMQERTREADLQRYEKKEKQQTLRQEIVSILKEASSTQGVSSSQPASSHTQKAGWSKPRSSLEAGWSMATLWVKRVLS